MVFVTAGYFDFHLHLTHMADVCVLFSGGVESAYLLDRERERGNVVHPVYVSSGYRWEDVEVEFAHRYLDAVDAPELTVLEAPADDVDEGSWAYTGSVPGPLDDGEHYLHGRNVLVFSKAAVYCSAEDIHEVVQGALDSNSFPDGTREFDEAMERALSIGLDHTVEIQRPLSHLVKRDVVERAADADLPLELTFSCLDPTEGRHCGSCVKCSDRSTGFVEAGVDDPTEYVNDPHAVE